MTVRGMRPRLDSSIFLDAAQARTAFRSSLVPPSRRAVYFFCPPRRWLSRDPFRSTHAIHRARRDGIALRAALYEFHYQLLVNTFAKAIEAGRM
jgi:hypothetical protein